MKNRVVSLFLSFFVIFSIFLFKFGSHVVDSVPPTNVKDTLSSSQLSYFARLGTGNTAGNTSIKIQLSGNPSNTTSNLFVGDTVGVGISSAQGLNTYTIRDIGNTSLFYVNIGLSAVNITNGLMVVATHSAIHTVAFTPKSNYTGGAWQFLIKASNRVGETATDGIPDQQGFDLGSTIPSGPSSGSGTRLLAADITCPFGASASIGATVTTIGSNTYHSIVCQLGGGATNPVDVGASIVVGRALTSGSQLINPAPALSHTEGQANAAADVYSFYIRHLDASGAVVDVDTMSGKIAVVEAVRVTATIDPTLTFIIDATGVGTGSTVCGNAGLGTNAANTTATTVSYGSLSIAAFNDLAQRISCVTNAASGYAVTVYQNGQIKNVNGNGVTIPDTNCDGSCGVGTTGAWITDNSNSEWGYSIQNIGASAVTFAYNIGSSFNAMAFGNGSAQAQTVMFSGVTPQTTERAYVCYRLTASTTQEAGNYTGQLIYTATATF